MRILDQLPYMYYGERKNTGVAWCSWGTQWSPGWKSAYDLAPALSLVIVLTFHFTNAQPFRLPLRQHSATVYLVV